MAGGRTELRKFIIPEFVTGPGARHLAGRYARNFGGSRVLVVTDPGIIAAGWAGEVTAGLEAAGLSCHPFSGLTANPKAEEVMAGARAYASMHCDTIVAVGGGSVIDCAKGIGVVNANGGYILEYKGVDQIASPGPPLICVPTTGSAADVSQFAIITEAGTRLKEALVSKTLVPDVSLLDPLVLTTMGRELTASTGMDALTHAFEAYVSNASSPLTDLLALKAARLIAAHLPFALEDPGNVEVRGLLMDGCLYAGLAFTNAGLGLLHAMAHSLGGYLDIQHGESNALLMKEVIAYNYEAAPERYAALGETLGLGMREVEPGQAKGLLLQAIDKLRRELRVGKPLRELGLERHHLAELAARAYLDPCVATNPRLPTKSEVEEIYARAF